MHIQVAACKAPSSFDVRIEATIIESGMGAAVPPGHRGAASLGVLHRAIAATVVAETADLEG